MTQNQIKYQEHRENVRTHQAQERETYRSDVAKENEQRRANLAREDENRRHNLQVESQGWRNLVELQRHNSQTEATGWANIAIGQQNANTQAAAQAAQEQRYGYQSYADIAGLQIDRREQDLTQERNDLTRWYNEQSLLLDAKENARKSTADLLNFFGKMTGAFVDFVSK